MNYYNLTNPQKSIWVTEKFYQGTAINTISGYIHITTQVNFDVLKDAIHEIIKTNDAMRLKVKEKDSSCVQYVDEYKSFNIDMIELSSKEEIEKIALKFANIPFALENQFLFKFLLFRLPNGSGGFFINVHHLIGDSWSLGLIAKEVVRIYSELLAGTYESQARPSYLNYIEAENNYKNSDKYIKDKEYWDEVFTTIPEIASISSVKNEQKKEISCKGDREKFTFSENDLTKIKAFCDKYKISVYNFFMAIYSLYVSRVTNLDDFVMGTPILNRTNFEQKHTMGMFISIAPLRINLNNEYSFVDFARKIATDTTSIFRHQKYSYQSILEDVRKRNSSIPNLYNIILSYQITKTSEESNQINYTTDWVFNGNSGDELQIHLFDLNDENSMTVAYDYKAEQFESQEITNLHNRILTIIHQIMENDNILLKKLEIITPEEEHKILYDFNNTAVDYPRDKAIVDLFEEQVKKTPDNIAVIFEDQKLTYRELNEKANQLARVLIQNGVAVDDVVGIYLNKSLEVIVSMFGILKAGAAFLPLDLDYPEDRLNYIINNSSPKVILSSKKITSNIKVPTILVDLSEEFYQKQDTANLEIPLSPENLMYVMYTSGSTGNPKGVMVKHKNIIRLAAFPNFIEFSENEVMVQTGTIVFDACIFEIFGSLLHGFKLYILKKENILNIPYFTKFLKEKNVSILFLTTGLFNQLGMQNPSMFSNLKYLLTGGDVISKASIQKIINCSPNLKIINCYGPTENGSYSTCYHVIGNEEIIPIGKPITNSSAYVVSNNLLCPIGVPGELWVGGDGIARGYINNEDLTKEHFIENPFGEGMIYKTGDLVKWLPDGNIAFLGRIDNQVKIRGFRIELSEIDRKLLSINGIKQSLTMVHNISNTKTICSYVISDEQIDTKYLKSTLEKLLPSYMIPTFITQLKEFPLNINGKVDMKSFPIPNINNEQKELVPSRNEVDKSIITTLSEVLNITNISITDSFFDLGGDSLSAIAFTNILSHKFNAIITASDVFRYPLIRDLSDYISTLSKISNKNTIKPVERKDYYHASSAQKRIYYASIIDDNSVLYNIAGGIIVDKPLDVALLEKCFKTLISRHEVLRTHFSIIDNDIVQIIDDNVDFNLKVEKTDSDDLNNIYNNFVNPFDLSKAPLFRVEVVKLKDNKMLLLLDMHHIISDGTSLSILLQELCDLYNGSTLPEKQVDYKDFTLWEKEEFEKEEFKQSKDFWVNQYQDEIPLLNMPTTFSRPSVQSFEGANYHTNLPKEVFEKVNEVSKNLGVTPYMLMLSVYYILLSKYSSQDDIVVGTPIVGRELPELSNMLGMFVNTLALRNKVDHNSHFDNFANSIKEYCLSAFKNQVYPFDELVKELNVKRDTSRNPLFDIMFIYQNNGYPEIKFKGTNSKYFIPDNNISKFDLSLEVIPIDNEYSLRFEYCTKLFDEDFIKRLASHYINILNTILENSKIKIADIDMLSEEERKQLLYDFNNTSVDYPRDKTIVDLFEEQVEKTPDNIAVVFEDQQLTYRELNEKANQLARYLIENGVTNNSIVGIMLPRSLEIMIAFLGVLKSGACYIPIDPTFPKERIEYMLENSNSSMLLKIKRVKGIDFKNITDIDVNDSIVYNYEKNNLGISINPDSPSYIIYTSGSTGKPKGVVLTHKSLMNLTCYLNNVVDYFKKEQYIAIASITTISFDIFLFETIISLQKGLKVVIANESQQTNPNLLDDLIYKHDIKAIQMTPSRMDIFINNKEYMPHLSNLKYITLAGEALPDELRDKLLELGDVTVYNGYGPSETTVFSTFTDVTKHPKVTIGKPLANTYVYILDKDKKLCPIGIPGELYISGDGVGKGYLNNPDLTKKSFMKDIFNPNLIMYKTGDLVKFLPNGELDYIGRVDNQVKIRGLRIELDEIQKWILQYDNVNKVVLSSSTDKNGRQYLIAYLTVTNRISVNELKIYLSRHIPKYMIPTYFMVLDEFPYLPNGKIDKKSLPLPNEDISSNKKFVAPTNKLEIEICQIFENLLSISPISIYDNFFEIGGDSLLAMSLQLELLKLNININYSDIFMFPTVKDLANHISSNSRKSLSKIDTEDMNKFDTILQNTINLPKKLDYSSPGNILLTGVTGFLGAHILSSFITNEKGKIYCLIRTEPGLTIEQKLLNKLHYYFGNQYDNLIGDRIILVQGDITTANLGLSQNDLLELLNNVDIVINSAAKVSHYGNYGDYKKINVDGTQNLVDFCLKNHKRFYQVSTLSVSGNAFIDDSYIKQSFENDIDFNENNFYINQALDNVYIRSKFEAEKVVLNSILNGLDGYILRVGNLMNRLSDGKFQPNVNENAYINRLISYYNIGCIPNYLLDGYLELTPVDCCANAIVKILQYNCTTNRIFHLLNHKNIDISYFIDTLNKFYDKINIVSNEDFLQTIDKILANPDNKNILSGIINDFDENRLIVYSSPVKIKSDFTVKYLSKIGFDWPELKEEYIEKFLKFFDNLNLLTRKDGI